MSAEVTLLGSFQARTGEGELTALPNRPSRVALLAYLAVEREVSRDRLIEAFRKKGEDPAKTRKRLNQTLHVLRSDLEEAGCDGSWLDSRSDVIRVSDGLRTDVQAFEAAVAASDHETALGLYSGEFLAGRDRLKDTPNFEPWVARVRDALRRQFQEMSLKRIDHLEATGAVDDAIETARKRVDLDPLDDEGQDRLIRLLAAAGRRSEALKQYFRYEESTWRAFGDVPLERTRDLIASLDAEPHTVEELRARDLAASAESGPSPTSLVVSWFESCGMDEAEPVALGVLRRLRAALARADALTVLPLSATQFLRDAELDPAAAGRRLNVAWVVSGSVQLRSEEDILVDVSLLRVKDGKSWSARYRPTASDDLYAVHTEIGRWVEGTVAGAVAAAGEAAAAARRIQKARAMSLFDVAYAGYEDRSRTGFELAVANLERAIGIDPNFARAHAKLADVYIAQAQFGFARTDAVMPLAIASANRAIELDPDLWEAYAARAHYRDTYAWDWEGAEADYLKAIELNPDDWNARTWYADMLTALGRERESREQMRLAEQAHPLSAAVQWSKGAQHYRAGRYAQAVDSLDHALQLKPGYEIAVVFRAFARTRAGDAEGARAQMEAARAASPYPVPTVELALCFANVELGLDDEAAACLARVQAVSKMAYVPALVRALMHGRLGQLDEAFDELAQAARERWGQLIYLNVDPLYEPLRADARFSAVTAQMGLA